jgi:pimeloyl-ACP methyl ester carboxylesterase
MVSGIRSSILVSAILVLIVGPRLAFAQSAPAAGQTVSLGGLEMYYETTGQGTPLLLLHGFTQTGRMWDPFVPALAEHYQVIVPDLRGHGGSTNPSGQFTMRQSARDVFALLDRFGIDRVQAIGSSAGAMTLLHMAVQQPARIEAMVLLGAGPYYSAVCREELAGYDLDQVSAAGWARLRQMHHHGDEQIRLLFAQLRALKDSYDDVNFTPPLFATIQARTLIVQGDRDICFPPSMAAEMQAAIPTAYLWVIPNGAHWPIRGELAPVFTETALAFLAGEWESP